MKRIIYLTWTALMLFLQGMCQNVINYDFLTKQFTINGQQFDDSKLVLNYNKTYRFSITNIDKRLFSEFSISSEQRDFFEAELDQSFSKLQTKAYAVPDSTETKNIDSLINAVNARLQGLEKEFLSIASKLSEKQKNNLLMIISNTENRNKELQKLINTLPPEETKKLEDNWEKQEIERKKQEAVNYYKNSYSILKRKADSVNIFFNNIEKMKELNNKLFNLSKQYNISGAAMKSQIEHLETEYQDVLNKKSTLMIEFDLAYLNFKEYLTEFKKDKKLVELQKQENDLPTEMNDLVKSVEDKKMFETSFNKDNGYNKLVEKIKTMIFRLKNETITDIYFADQILPKKDQIQINVEYKEANPNRPNGGFVIPKKYPYTFDIEGGAKITMSTGLMLTGLLYDRKYSIYPAVDSGYSIIKQDSNKNLIQPTIGALMHILYRSSSTFTGGFTWGIGTNLSELTNMTLFIGASLFIGRDERFIVSAGFATAPVSYLRGKYSTNTPIKNSEIDQNGITEKAFRPGFFFGFTYNLINQKKEKSGASINN
jgi:hypothetical protein